MEEMSAALFVLVGPIPMEGSNMHPHRVPCATRRPSPVRLAAVFRLQELLGRSIAGARRMARLGIRTQAASTTMSRT